MHLTDPEETEPDSRCLRDIDRIKPNRNLTRFLCTRGRV